MANIREIAKECNLSVATISRYINKKGNVSKKASEKIEEVIQRLNYTTNEHAKAIFSEQSNIIGLIFPDFLNPYFGEMATLLGGLLQDVGYKTILCFTEDDKEKEFNALKIMKGYRVDGIFIARAKCIDEISKMTIPVISFETIIENTIVVSADNYTGGRMACDYFLSKGKKKLAHLIGPRDFKAVMDRYNGFQDRAKEIGMDIDVLDFDLNLLDMKAVYERLATFDYKKYDAIFAFNDISAGFLIDYLKKIQIRVPEEISVIGFDNSFMAKFMSPSLTTMEQSIFDIVHRSYDLLMNAIKTGDKQFVSEKIPVKLIERDSV